MALTGFSQSCAIHLYIARVQIEIVIKECRELYLFLDSIELSSQYIPSTYFHCAEIVGFHSFMNYTLLFERC